MSLIKSISGIRGTIGGSAGESLTPLDIVKFTAAYASFIRFTQKTDSNTIVVGRDARVSGKMVNALVAGALNGCGYDVIDIGLATTPTTELAVQMEGAAGGIIITASHNPKQWNALKLLNEKGEFLNAKEGQEMLRIAESETFEFAPVDKIGSIVQDDTFTLKHIEHVLSLPCVDIAAIKKADFHVAIDCINSVGGIVIPPLLQALGVNIVHEINCEPTGLFAHNPEPLPEHLTDIAALVRNTKADVGFVVDPDVDRLAIICEDGSMFGEEYTLVSVSDYILQHTPGNTVSNMSSTRALRDLTEKYGQSYSSAAVGEVNVVETMKATHAVIGGEGNGGIIYPASHYGRDALVGIALFLSHLAKSGLKTSELKAIYPEYYMVKQKIELAPNTDMDRILAFIQNQYSGFPIATNDGVKIDFPNKWAHLRRSNTEPIIRIYTEAQTKEEAASLAHEMLNLISTA